ncbi:MAG: GNAT family N-acetyltransferase [Tissierellia bacterium]|nr:GNAT family N-acetyltransferase [Tissierellia bacterium]
MELRLVELEDDSPLHSLYLKEGIELGNEPVLSDFIKVYALKRGEDYLAGAGLARRGGYLIIDAIAVDRDYQGQGLGRKLMKELLNYPREEDLYLVAQVPEFFRKFGFEGLDMGKCPKVFGCSHCDRQGVDCFPLCMVLRKNASMEES